MDASELRHLPLLLFIASVVLLVVVVVWIVLPFAVLGTKPLLRELIAEQQHTNKLLAQLGRLLDPEHKIERK